VYDRAILNTSVTWIEQAGNGWDVETSSGVRQHYSLVAVCNGAQRTPHFPDPAYPGTFSGTALHAMDYKSPAQLAGKRVLVIGAGEMADETLRYLKDAGATQIHVINRSPERALSLAKEWSGVAVPWERLDEELQAADLVIGAAAADEALIKADRFSRGIASKREQRPLFMLDLGVPRNFDPAIGDELGVYLYSLDDLKIACDRNLKARAAELPKAEQIILAETEAFIAAAHHRLAAPVITGLRRNLEAPKQAELQRLFKKLPDLDERTRAEITQFADRLVNKLLHPPLESIRDAAQEGPPHGLLDALRRLFRLED
jgi:glutamyl-tRNA reductase